MELVAFGAGSAMAMFVVMGLLAPLAVRVGHLDRPDGERKIHDGEIPLIGGPAILCILLLAVPLAPGGTSPLALGTLLAAIGIATLGAVDDRVGLGAGIRLVGQVLLAMLVVLASGVVITHVGDLSGRGEVVELGLLAPIVTILALAAAMNAYNMLDGIDGQAAMLALVPAIGLVAGALLAGAPVPVATLVLCGVLPVFLLFNLCAITGPLPKCFLGDSGALLLGLLVATSLIDAAFVSAQWLDPMHALWFAAVPIFDTLFVIIYRVLHGRSPLSADRNHVHHLLQDLGLGPRGALFVVSLAALFLMLVGLGLVAAATETAAGLFVYALAFVFYCACALSLHRRRPERVAERAPAAV